MREPHLYLKSDVDALGDPNLWARIQNKVIGGKSADDGRKMEHIYAVMKLVEIGSDIVCSIDRLADINDNADVTQYARCLVDDLRTRNAGETVFYQLKSGRVPIAEVVRDVENQSKLDPVGAKISYVVVVVTPRRAALLKNASAKRKVPLNPEVFAFSKNWRLLADKNPCLLRAMTQLSGHHNDNRHQALFGAMSGTWLHHDDVYVREFIFEVWKQYRGLFIGWEFPPHVSSVNPHLRRFETSLRMLGFAVSITPELYVACGNLNWSPVVACEDAFFTDFMSWFDAYPRSNAEIMTWLGSNG